MRPLRSRVEAIEAANPHHAPVENMTYEELAAEVTFHWQALWLRVEDLECLWLEARVAHHEQAP